MKFHEFYRFWGLLIVLGCGADREVFSGRAFETAFPKIEALKLSSLGIEMNPSLVSSHFGLLTASIQVMVNQYTIQFLTTLGLLTMGEPQQVSEKKGTLVTDKDPMDFNAWARWGPRKDSAGGAIEFLLDVFRKDSQDSNRSDFVYLARGRALDKEPSGFQDVAFGGASETRLSSEDKTRRGLLVVNLDGLRELDPNFVGVGEVRYSFVEEEEKITVALEGIGIWAYYGRTKDKIWMLEYDVQADIEGDPGDLEENLHILAGWKERAGGRADVFFTGGDFGESTGTMVECWDEHGNVTYFSFSAGGGEIQSGDLETCLSKTPWSSIAFDIDSHREGFPKPELTL